MIKILFVFTKIVTCNIVLYFHLNFDNGWGGFRGSVPGAHPLTQLLFSYLEKSKIAGNLSSN